MRFAIRHCSIRMAKCRPARQVPPCCRYIRGQRFGGGVLPEAWRARIMTRQAPFDTSRPLGEEQAGNLPRCNWPISMAGTRSIRGFDECHMGGNHGLFKAGSDSGADITAAPR